MRLEQVGARETHQERNVVAHHELHLLRQRRALRHVDKVLQAEGERDRLVHLDSYSLKIVVVVIVRLFRLLGRL